MGLARYPGVGLSFSDISHPQFPSNFFIRIGVEITGDGRGPSTRRCERHNVDMTVTPDETNAADGDASRPASGFEKDGCDNMHLTTSGCAPEVYLGLPTGLRRARDSESFR